MTYDIRENQNYNSREVYFDGKPSEAVRTALKELKMRWHGAKKCWYGYAQENAIIAAILGANDTAEPDELASVTTEGYLGGGAVYGSKSGKHLYGADLSTAIREDIKRAGIKGVTVSCKTYAGGQSITAKIKLPKAAFVSLGAFTENYEINTASAWIDYTDESGKVQTMHRDEYFGDGMTAARQEEIRKCAARYEYYREAECENDINVFYIDKYKVYTAETTNLIKRVNSIICAYRYDESNGMVDYFNTNFYYDIKTIPQN